MQYTGQSLLNIVTANGFGREIGIKQGIKVFNKISGFLKTDEEIKIVFYGGTKRGLWKTRLHNFGCVITNKTLIIGTAHVQWPSVQVKLFNASDIVYIKRISTKLIGFTAHRILFKVGKDLLNFYFFQKDADKVYNTLKRVLNSTNVEFKS